MRKEKTCGREREREKGERACREREREGGESVPRTRALVCVCVAGMDSCTLASWLDYTLPLSPLLLSASLPALLSSSLEA